MNASDGFTKNPVLLALAAILLVQSPVIAWNLLRAAPVSYAKFTRAAALALGPWRAGGHDQRIEAPGGKEPAYLSYWARQVWTDSATAVVTGAGVVWRYLVDDWLKGRVMRLLRTYALPYRRKGAFELATTRFFGCGVALGAMLGVLVAAVVALAALLLSGALLAAACVLLAAAALAIRVTDSVRLRLANIRMRCPHPGCYHRIALPVYRCPSCNNPHRSLLPGRYGILRRVCGCGRALPTSFLTGRHRLAAECPQCRLPLPNGLGSARLVHVPLIGGTSSGKTMLLLAMVTGLRAWAEREELRLEFALDSGREEYERAAAAVAAGGWAFKTQVPLPTAVMLYVGRGRRRRLLYLYDPRGEALESGEKMREQEYLAHADGLVLVADVLADPWVRGRLTDEERTVADAASPSAESPMATYERLAGEFSAMSGRRHRTPVAVVVTKRDVIHGLASLPPLGASVDGWLTEVGLENLVRGVEHDFGASTYWAVSAHGAAGPRSTEAEQLQVAGPIMWLLGRTGLRVVLPKVPDYSSGPPVQSV
ncbi:hypothetical protein OG607_33190 [Streptomyces sp. NBC_01537]|uniref:TRAFAC clade GTPase domain-containing protein n=1 Tax=Streptomyces sp. NBC_01537 TaxID=2903896 RepID=UPI003867DC49